MKFSRLTTERFLNDSGKIDYTYQISIDAQYKEFLRFFSDKQIINFNDLIVGSHMLYGRMPTMLRFDSTKLDVALLLVNRIKNGEDANLEDLKVLKAMLNNSMVGCSKLLHFLAPERFAILDSRIFRYINGKDRPTQISNTAYYFDYLKEIRILSSKEGFIMVHDHVMDKMNATHTKMRTAELVMFEIDKLNSKSAN